MELPLELLLLVRWLGLALTLIVVVLALGGEEVWTKERFKNLVRVEICTKIIGYIKALPQDATTYISNKDIFQLFHIIYE